MVPRSDADLVTDAAAGSESAFRVLYRRHVRPVYWLAHGLVGSTADAEDVTQETFLVAWRKISGFTLESDSLLPWLATICRFQCANRVRRLARDRIHTSAALTDDVAADTDVAEDAVRRALVERILREVDTLSSLDQGIFRLCAADGFSYQEAADRLGVTHAVVRNRLSRIRSRLRSAVDPEAS